MFANTSRIPEDRRVYLLADHLDAVLASGEDLKSLCHERANVFTRRHCSTRSLSLEAFVARARKLEFAAMGHIKLARYYAGALSRRDDRLSGLARLFASGTSVVVDAINDICDSERHAFRDGFDPLVYLRGRGLICEEAGCLRFVDRISIDDRFLLAERIELGPLLDLCSQFLELLDKYFDLFQNESETGALAPLANTPLSLPALPEPEMRARP